MFISQRSKCYSFGVKKNKKGVVQLSYAFLLRFFLGDLIDTINPFVMKYIISLFLSITALSSSAQGVFMNFDIDTTVWDVKAPVDLWMEFLNTKDDSLGAEYWNAEEVSQYGVNDYLALGKELNYGHPNFLELLSYANIRIMSVRERSGYFKISNVLSFMNQEGKEDVHCMFYVYAGYEKGELKLFNPLKVNKELRMNSEKIGLLTYYFPKNHFFDKEKAQRQNDFITQLAMDFGVPAVEIDYYFAGTTEEMQELKGFDFLYGDNGPDRPTGRAYVKDKAVYTSGIGEYYPHEIIHVLVNPYYPDAHLWLIEGLATYYGMSRGKDITYHLKKLNKHLRGHPEIDLNNMLALNSIDAETDYRYVLGGFIIGEILKKDGIEGVKLALQGGRQEEDFYRVIEEQLGIERSAINTEFRKRIKKAVR